MGKARLLASACALALLCGAPAFAATNAADTAPGGSSMGNDNSHQANTPDTTGSKTGNGMTGMNNSGAASSTTTTNPSSPMHASNRAMPGTNESGNSSGSINHTGMHGAMTHHATRTMHNRGGSDTSQNGQVDDLNAQSLRAAQQGQPFQVGSGGGGVDNAPSNSGSMSNGSGGTGGGQGAAPSKM